MKRKLTSLLLAALLLLTLLPPGALAEDDTVITQVNLMIPAMYEEGMTAAEYMAQCYVEDHRYCIKDLWLWLDEEDMRAPTSMHLVQGDWFTVHAVLVPSSVEYSFADGCRVLVNRSESKASYKTEVVEPRRLEMHSVYVGMADDDPRMPEIVLEPADGYLTALRPAVFTFGYQGAAASARWQYCLPGEEAWQETGHTGTTLTVEDNDYPLGTRFRGALTWEIDYFDETRELTRYTSAATLHLMPTVECSPEDRSVRAGSTVTFTAGALDAEAWRWYRREGENGPAVLIRSAVGSSLTFEASMTDNETCYYAVAVSKDGTTAQTATARLHVYDTEIIDQTHRVFADPGDAFMLYVTTDKPAISYEWYTADVTDEAQFDRVCERVSRGPDGKLYGTRHAPTGDIPYKCRVYTGPGPEDYFTSDIMWVSLRSVRITRWPDDVYVSEGSPLCLLLEAHGEGAVQAQWQRQEPGSTQWLTVSTTRGDDLTLRVPAEAAMDKNLFRAVVTDDRGDSETTGTCTVHVMDVPPVITAQPAAVKAAEGEEAVFTVKAEGPVLTYRWQEQKPGTDTWTDCAEATANRASLCVTADAAKDGTCYRCVVTNMYARSVTSDAARLIKAVPLRLLTDVTDTKVEDGQDASFRVAAEGLGLTYAWEMKKAGESTWTALDGTQDSVAFAADRSMDGALVRCTVTDDSGNTAVSGEAKLTVGPKPILLTAQPQSLTVCQEKKVTFSVQAEGEGLTWQWQQQKPGATTWASCVSATGKTATLAINAREAVNGYTYRCVVSRGDETALSDTAVLTFRPASVVITHQPEHVSVTQAQRVTFTAAASGEGLTWQWQQKKPGSTSWASCVSATGKTPTLAINAREAVNGYTYRCVVTGSGETAVTREARLSFRRAVPVITAQPESLTVTGEKRVTFTVAANGKDLTWQWQQQKPGSSVWANCVSATGKTPTLAINAREAVNGYTYRCVITGGGTKVISDTAKLTVR